MERKTRQREAMLEALKRAPGPVQPQELRREASARGIQLSLATVYRNLNAWVAEGVLSHVQLPGEAARFEMADKAHHHYFSCRTCRQVYDLDRCVREGLGTLLPKGFKLEDHEIVLYGTCASCGCAKDQEERYDG